MDDFKKSYNDIPIPENLDSVIDTAIEKAEKKRVLRFTKPLVTAACISAIVLGLNPILIKHSSLSNAANNNKNTITEENKILAAADKSPLPVVGSLENLTKLIEQSNSVSNNYKERANDIEKGVKDGSSFSVKNYDINTPSYSIPNNQVDGVDEADKVLTDGEFIYSINSNKLIITKVNPAASMEVIQNIDLDKNLHPVEMFIDDNHLVVICNKTTPFPSSSTNKESATNSYSIRKYPVNILTTKITIFDLSNKNSVKELKSFEVSGNYVSSRKIGSKVYLVSNQYIYNRLLKETDPSPYKLPFYRNSDKTDYNYQDLNDVKYFPQAISNSFINIAALDLNKLDKSFNISSFLGSANNMYVSQDNLYIAGMGKDTTSVYKFSLSDGNAKYLSKAEIPGCVINQFSMDEAGEYFRIATTKRETITKNNIYVLDKNMNTIGKLEDLAQGEVIYSTRFMGNRAYMVTFKTTDPLFVIDLKIPSEPTVLGELKIPGFSNYLHPYDENHILGFGKDAVESNGTAYQQGMKIALFDVSDVNNPKEQFSTTIGDRGTDSELLKNHKALLFSKEKNLLVFPINVAQYDSKIKGPKASSYGNMIFSGAYVYSIDPEKGFILKGQITHNEIKKNTVVDYNMGYNQNTINRILYIDNTLYTVSSKMIKATDLNTMKEIKSLKLP